MEHLEIAYILSWFGNDDVREQRKRVHQKQVEWLLEKNLKLVILPQQYKKGEKILDNNITYLSAPPTLLRPASGRNQFLPGFYESDMDFAILVDNDCILDKHNLGHRCIQDFDMIYKYGFDIDLFIPENDFGGMPRLDIKQNIKMQDHYVFVRSSSFPGGLTFVRNIKKFYGLEIYYDSEFDTKHNGEMLIGEDCDFGLQFIVNGLGAYKCKSIILEEKSPKHSTWERQERLDTKRRGSAYLLEKYRSYGIRYKDGGYGSSYFYFLKNYFMKPQRVEIPIDEEKQKLITIKKPRRIKYNINKWIGEIDE